MLDALRFTEEHGEVCPANWKAGDEGMKPMAEGVAGYLARNAKWQYSHPASCGISSYRAERCWRARRSIWPPARRPM